MPRIKLDDFNKQDTMAISEIVLDALREKEFNPTGFHFRVDVNFYEDGKGDSPNYGETSDDDSYWNIKGTARNTAVVEDE